MERLIELLGRSGARRPTAVAAVVISLTVAAAGCGHDRGGDRTLVDGSRPPPLPDVLGDVGPAPVTSRVRLRRAAQLDTRRRACLDAFRPEFRISPRTVVVERTGVAGANLTFLDASRRVVLGCDRTGRPVGGGRSWCARSVGRLLRGRLQDPRVDILCHGALGARIGFGWIVPASGTRWIASRNGAVTEIAAVAAGLPVRVATADVDTATSSATFEVTEYDEDGATVRRYTLHASVAG